MDFLLELRSEEMPARMQDRARDDLARLFAEALASAGLAAAATATFATPRRLALIARGLPQATAPVREETKGPRASAPPQALEGFLRKTGLAREALEERDGVLFAVVERPGRPTAALLADAIPAIVRAFPWPRSMRWGAASADPASLRWVRPLHGIVALFGEEVVPCAIDGIASGAATLGHRFHHPGPITIGSADDYVEKLRLCHVIVDQAERRRLIADGAASAAAAEGLALVADEALVAENAGLTEWPVPLLGRFDPAFLEVPREVIQLTMRTNQKYFACVDGEGVGALDASQASKNTSGGRVLAPTLAPAFVCTANIAASDGGAAIVAGNRKVLAARLSDARFFWEQDRKVPLEEQARKLAGIVFHERLGTVADKVERVAKLARWLVEEGIVPSSSPRRGEGDHAQHGGGASALAREPLHHQPAAGGPPPHAAHGEDRVRLADMAEQAARLCKADLVTGMVGEFPELQGVMGGYYARAEGLPEEVADAIRDHYKPVGQGDDVPTAPVTVAVSLADKLDTVAEFFLIGEAPTGSRDPFALRRAALAVISTVLGNRLRFRMERVLRRACEDDPDKFEKLWFGTTEKGLGAFLADRLKVQQREAGVRHDLIDAVFALGGEDDLLRLLARVRALQAFVATEEGANLLAGYKRAANILRKEGWTSEQVRSGGERGDPPDPAEAALAAALDAAEPAADAAIADERFAEAMAALASLRAPIDAFFEQVTVNDPDPARREGRLALLARVRDAVHRVADFSRIEG